MVSSQMFLVFKTATLQELLCTAKILRWVIILLSRSATVLLSYEKFAE